MKHPKPDSDGLSLELLDALYQDRLRSAVAEVAAAIAHAAGTPLNVISGRAELIRQDPTNALAQVTRIEEQVNKLANGLREVVDYLAAPEQPREDVPVPHLIAEARRLAEPSFRNSGVALHVEAVGVDSTLLDRVRLTDTLSALLSWAAHSTAKSSKETTLRLSAIVADGVVTFEIVVPGLELLQGWRLEQFAARPGVTAVAQHYRMLSICAAMARGRGDRVLVDAAPESSGVRVRLTCEASGAHD